MHHEQLPMLDTAKHQHLHEELAPHAKAYKVLKEQGFYEQLFSPEFSRLLYFFLVNSFWLNFYIGAFDVQLGDAHFLSVAELASNASLFTVVITCGAVIIPLAGAMMDIYDFPCTSFVTIIAGVVWAILLLFKTKFTLVLSFISYAVFRTFFYTFVFAYLADVMGFKYFGILAGIMFVIGGILTFLQYPIAQFAAGSCHNLLSEACDEGNWNTMNIIMMLTIFSTLYFTYKDWIHREEFKAIQANKPPQPSRSVGRNNSAKYRKLPSNEMVPLAGSNSTYGAV